MNHKWDNENVMDYAIKTAKQEADQKAREEERAKIALKLLAKGTPIDEITELTGLTIEEIQAL